MQDETAQMCDEIIRKIKEENCREFRLVRNQLKEILKAINSRNIDGLDIRGPRTAECREQVMSVVAFLANPRHLQSIYHACNITFRFCTGGYDDAERLYLWCHRNESRIWTWVETYRLDHDLDWSPINAYQN